MSDLVEEETKSQESLAQRHHDELISVLVRIACALDALEVELCPGVRGISAALDRMPDGGR
jgi:hypothetical protein